MVNCCILGCKSRSEQKYQDITFHRFPKDNTIRNVWRLATGRLNWEPNKFARMCSNHFKDHYLRKTQSKVYLEKFAVPTLAIHATPTAMEPATAPEEGYMGPNCVECRVCLTEVEMSNAISIFSTWSWSANKETFVSTVALEMGKLANIEVPSIPGYPSHICSKCQTELKQANLLIYNIKKSEKILRNRSSDLDIEKAWPKPIQVDKNINGEVLNRTLDVEVKQEIVSDDDETYDDEYSINAEEMDIKVEPEEIVEQPKIQVTVNGTISQAQLDKFTATNTCEVYENVEFLDSINTNPIKEEPISEDEILTDIPLECMLCSKKLHTMSGLKAHVIAHHNYKTVKRKSDDSLSPGKKGAKRKRYCCSTCKRSFVTSTDLIVHEVCHNKFSCFACNNKFETFEEVTEHRTHCTVQEVACKPKTLVDILRQRLAQRKEDEVLQRSNSLQEKIIETGTETKNRDLKVRVHCLKCSDKFDTIDEYKVHKELHDMKNVAIDTGDGKIENQDITNIKQEVCNNTGMEKQDSKDETDAQIKKAKQDAEINKIEIELESIFDIAVEKENNRNIEIEINCEEQNTITNIVKQEKTVEDILTEQSESDNILKETNSFEQFNGVNANSKFMLPVEILPTEVRNDVSHKNNESHINLEYAIQEQMALETNSLGTNIQQDKSSELSDIKSEACDNVSVGLSDGPAEEGIVVVNIEKNQVSDIFFYENEDSQSKVELNRPEVETHTAN